MGLKDILVHVDGREPSAARVDAAVTLAARSEAHLVGLHVISVPQIPTYVEAQLPPEITKRQLEYAKQAAEEAHKMFESAASSAGIQYEWRTDEGDTVDRVSMHARYCDIAIVGQQEDAGVPSEMPDRLILSVGRPVLLIPRVGSYPVIGDQVMVAWDASRLATRAVNDALPVLRRAKQVSVIAINPRSSDEEHGQVPSADISLHLARHGVKAEAQHTYADDISAGDMILSRAADAGADLLVMGAYGHARWRELVMGGVTRHMLQHMTLPVFMSH